MLLTRSGIEGVLQGSPAVQLTQIGIEAVFSNQQQLTGTPQSLTTVWPNAIRGLTWTVNRSFTFNTIIPDSANQLEIAIANSPNPLWTWEFIYDYIKNDAADIQSIYWPYTDLQTFIGFLMARQGRYDEFLFYDPSPDMNEVGPHIWQPVPVLQTGNYYPTGYVIIDPNGYQQSATVGGLSRLTIPSFATGSGAVTADGNISWTNGGLFPGSSAQPLQFFSDGFGNYYSPLQRYYGGQFYEDVTDLNTSPYPLRLWANGLPMQSSPASYQLFGPGLPLSPLVAYYGRYVKFTQWTPFTAYLVGGVLIDPLGHAQRATTAGLTGNISPPWNDSGGQTLDGGVLWQDTGRANITASFNYYWRCRLSSDSSSYEQFMKFLFTIGGQKTKNGSASIKIQQRRPVAAPPSCEVYPWNL